jgi:hypothetical protein
MRHPNIVLFLGACMHEPNLCFITEFARRGNFHPNPQGFMNVKGMHY